MDLSQSIVSKLVPKFRGRKILVIGDFILDHFVWGDVERISPEAPVPVVDVREESYRLGGALNVAANLAALGAKPSAVGILGEDVFADQVRRLAESNGITLKAVTSLDRPTIRKTRILGGSQQMVRIDREVRGKPDAETIAGLMRYILDSLKSTNAIIVSDYAKGVIQKTVLNGFVPKANHAGIPIVADPKVQNFWSFRNVTLLTPNTKEAGEALDRKLKTEADIESAGRAILNRLHLKALLITRGEHGMSLIEPHNRVTHIPTRAQEVFDVTGAGDTVTAVTALGLAAGLSMHLSLELANLAAGIVVGKVGTAVVTPQELIAAV